MLKTIDPLSIILDNIKDDFFALVKNFSSNIDIYPDNWVEMI